MTDYESYTTVSKQYRALRDFSAADELLVFHLTLETYNRRIS